MKKKNHPRDFVQLDEIRAFTSQLTCTQEIAAARGQRAAATGNIEPVEARKTESLVEKVVGLLLESSVRAGDYKSVRAVRRPSLVGVAQVGNVFRARFEPGIVIPLGQPRTTS